MAHDQESSGSAGLQRAVSASIAGPAEGILSSSPEPDPIQAARRKRGLVEKWLENGVR